MAELIGVALGWTVIMAFMAIGQMVLRALLGKKQDDDHLAPPSAFATEKAEAPPAERTLVTEGRRKARNWMPRDSEAEATASFWLGYLILGGILAVVAAIMT